MGRPLRVGLGGERSGNTETNGREQPWAREEREAATEEAADRAAAEAGVRVAAGTVDRAVAAGIAIRAVAVETVVVRATGTAVPAVPSRNMRRSASSARRSGSKSVRSAARTAETVPGKAKPGRAAYAPPRS